MGTDANGWMSMMSGACRCSLLIDIIFPVKWEVESSAESEDGEVGGLRGEERI